jgi:hypothetical protein
MSGPAAQNETGLGGVFRSQDIGVVVLAVVSLGTAYAVERMVSDDWVRTEDSSAEARQAVADLGLSMQLRRGMLLESDLVPDPSEIGGVAFSVLSSGTTYPTRVEIRVRRQMQLPAGVPLSASLIGAKREDQFLFTPLPGSEPVLIDGESGERKEFVFATKPGVDAGALPVIVAEELVLVVKGPYLYQFALLADEQRMPEELSWFERFLDGVRFVGSPREAQPTPTPIAPVLEVPASVPASVPATRPSPTGPDGMLVTPPTHDAEKLEDPEAATEKARIKAVLDAREKGAPDKAPAEKKEGPTPEEIRKKMEHDPPAAPL